jgi:hypothetical protein
MDNTAALAIANSCSSTAQYMTNAGVMIVSGPDATATNGYSSVVQGQGAFTPGVYRAYQGHPFVLRLEGWELGDDINNRLRISTDTSCATMTSQIVSYPEQWNWAGAAPVNVLVSRWANMVDMYGMQAVLGTVTNSSANSGLNGTNLAVVDVERPDGTNGMNNSQVRIRYVWYEKEGHRVRR